MAPIQSRKILYVDDDPLQAELGKRALEGVGYSVDIQTNPLTALSEVGADPGRYDAIVTDYRMPELVGTGLAQEIRDIRSDLPIMLVTGDGDALKKTSELHETFDAVMSKPFTVAALRSATAALFADKALVASL